MKDRMIFIMVTLIGIILIFAFLFWQTYGVRLTSYAYSHSQLPRSFSGFKIVQISDFHNTAMLADKVISMTQAEKPDIIAITGDLIDCRRTDVDTAVQLVEKLVEIAPVYYVCGNHEAKLDDTDKITDIIRSKGVIVLENSKVWLQRENHSITLMGVKDPQFFYNEEDDEYAEKVMTKNLKTVTKNDDSFKILLSHRPELMKLYRQYDVRLVLTGHAHGGQFGIPFTDVGVYVPNQGLFPRYAAGMKQLDDTTMIISRGIGNSVFPFRLFNRPEVISVEFK